MRLRPEDVPLLPPERYPHSAAGRILAMISSQIRYEQGRGRTPARIRLDVYKIQCLREAYGWPRGPWTLFGLPVVEVAPQICVDVEPLGDSSERGAFARMVDDAKIDQLLR